VSDMDLGSIETEMEQTRERLATTIDQIFYRASPKTIVRRQVDEVKAFFIDGNGAPRTDNIAKVAGGLFGAVALIVVIRKIVK
jgi:hypothetical protein